MASACSATPRPICLYKVDAPYRPHGEGGILWNDPELAITWPLQDPIVSARDRALPTLDEHRRARRTIGTPGGSELD